MLTSSPEILERALSLVELGAARRRSGHRADARMSLREGMELARRCGARPLADRAHEELIAAGAKPRSTALSGVASLTPSERRVAAMAAEGMSNPQIAQALFVTLRTVEMHLSNAFRKLESDPGRSCPARWRRPRAPADAVDAEYLSPDLRPADPGRTALPCRRRPRRRAP